MWYLTAHREFLAESAELIFSPQIWAVDANVAAPLTKAQYDETHMAIPLFRFPGKRVDTALELDSAPAAGAGMRTFGWNAGTGFAADAAISTVVERQVLDPVLARVAPDLLPGPCC